MNRIYTSQLENFVGKEVLVKGWVRLRRDHGKLIFLDIRDKEGIVQVVVNAKISGEAFEKAKELRPEDVVKIIGKVNERPASAVNPNIVSGKIELEAVKIEVISQAETLPFDMGGEFLNLELPTLLDFRSLALRHPKIASIFKIQESISNSFRKTLKEEGFTEIFPPTIVPSATEGGAEVFPIDYYDKKTFLAQSPQLYKQVMVSVFEKVFAVSHAYRAEPSVTTRHLSEYVSLDAEMGMILSWDELMETAEKVVKEVLVFLSENNKTELKQYGVEIPVVKGQIPRVRLKDAQEIILKRTKKDNRNEPDLDPSDEKEICKWAMEEYGFPFVFITHFPLEKRPFYTMPDPSDPNLTLSFDLLGISEEWVTGGQRINNYEMLIESMKKRKLDPEKFEMYLQAFKYGMPPEGGFAIGLERVTKDILGLSNIREASLFPRDMERVDERFSRV